MSDIEDFFATLNERMDMPDESITDYISRMTTTTSRDSSRVSFLLESNIICEEKQEQGRESAFYTQKPDKSRPAQHPERTALKRALEGSALATSKRQKRDERRSQIDGVASKVVAEKFNSIERCHDVSDKPHISLDDDQPSPGAHGPRLPSLTPAISRSRISDNEVHRSILATSTVISSPQIIEAESGTREGTLRAGLAHGNLQMAVHPAARAEFSGNPSREAGIAAQSSRNPILKIHPHTYDKAPTDDSRFLAIVHTPLPSFPASPFTPNAYVATPSEEPTPVHMKNAHQNNQHAATEITAVRKGGNAVPYASKTHARVISGFDPIATSTQRLEKHQSKPAKSRVAAHSNTVQSARGSERDQVMKSAPNPVQHTETILDKFSAAPGSALEARKTLTAGPSNVSAVESSKANRKSTLPQKKSTILKGKKAEKARVTPLQYAQTLCDKMENLTKKSDYLKDKRVFYAGGDMHYVSDVTMKKMSLIIKNGGTLVPEYSPEKVTHILTDTSIATTLRVLSIKSLKDVPRNIPIVTWSWITEGRGGTGLTEKEHAAFLGHIVDSLSEKDGSDDYSRISMFTQDKPQLTPKVSHPDAADLADTLAEPLRGEGKVTQQADDPLADFYALAKAEQDNDFSGADDPVDIDPDDSVDEKSDDAYSGVPIKRGFTCDTKIHRPEICVNQDIVDKLKELMELHKSKPSKDDFWRGFSYGKSIGPIRNHPRRIQSYAEARSIRGVGDKTAEKIMEIINTGNLRRIAFENTGDVEAAKLFTGIYGVGKTIAYRWYASGCRTLDDLREGKNGVTLSSAMEIGLRYYEDINTRMPREEAETIFNLIKPIALKLDPTIFIQIMGSYRRGKEDCGDIDVLICRPPKPGEKRDNRGEMMPRLLQALHQAGILTDDLALPDSFDNPEACYRGLCKLPDHEANGKFLPRRRRRIDILSMPWQNRGGALLYYTGDDIFNRAMRFKANKMGYSLNQRGLFEGIVRDLQDRRIKINTGNLIASETEEEIFKILGVPWQEPHERVRS